jgi:hypothetical protein
MTTKLIKIIATLFLLLSITVLNISAMAISEIEVFYDDSSYGGYAPGAGEIPVLVVCDDDNQFVISNDIYSSESSSILVDPGQYTVYFIALSYIATVGSAVTDSTTLQAVCSGNTEYIHMSDFTIEDGQRAVVNADGSPDYFASGGPTAAFDYDDLFLVDTNTVSNAGVTALDLFFLGVSNYGVGDWPLSSIDRFCLNGSLITPADFDSYNSDPTAGPIESRMNVTPGLYEFSDYSLNPSLGIDECESEVVYSVNVAADELVQVAFSIQLSPQNQLIGFNLNTDIESLNNGSNSPQTNSTPSINPGLGLVRTGGADK